MRAHKATTIVMVVAVGSILAVPVTRGLLASSTVGEITTVAGNGTGGYSGDGGPATAAQLNGPAGMAAGNGAFFFAENGNSIVRKVDSAGVITTVAGNATLPNGYTGDGGPATAAELNGPSMVAVDTAGDLFIADTGNNVIRRVDATTQIITTVAGKGTGGYTGDGGAATAATLQTPTGVAVDAAGNVFIVDQGNNVIRRVDATTQVITTVAGDGTAGYTGDGGQATKATLNGSVQVVVDSAGDLFIADGGNNVIRRVDVTTQVITTVAGNGTAGYTGDGGPATSAELTNPQAVAVDAAGDIFIADPNNSVVREVNAVTQVITTVAGSGSAGYTGDGGPATSATLNVPQGLAVDGAGNLLIADFSNNVIRSVTGAAGPPPTTTTTSTPSTTTTSTTVPATTTTTTTVPPTTTTTSTTMPPTTTTSTTMPSTTTTTTGSNGGPPKIAFLTPQLSRVAGGTPVRISGTGFLGTTKVTFGGADAVKFKVVDSSLITAIPPSAAAAGASDNTSVDVTVTNPHGSDTGRNIPSGNNADTRGLYYSDAVFSVTPTSGFHRTPGGGATGDPFTVALTGYKPNTYGAVLLANPLLGYLEGGPDFKSAGFNGPPPYTGIAGFGTTDANGSLSLPETLPPMGGGQSYDTNIDCPPTQATVDFGLPSCLVIFGPFAIGSFEKDVSFLGTPTASPPSLVLSSSSAAEGDTVSLSGVRWNASPYFGSNNATTGTDPGQTPLKVDICKPDLTACTPEPANATVDPTQYQSSSTTTPIVGVFSGTNLAGSFTVSGTAACFPTCVVRVQQEGYAYDSYTGQGTGQFISATAPLTITGTPPTTSTTTSTSTTSTTATSTTSTTIPTSTTTTIPTSTTTTTSPTSTTTTTSPTSTTTTTTTPASSTTTTTLPATVDCGTANSTSSTAGAPTAQVSPSPVAAGGNVNVSGGGFAAGASLSITLCSSPIALGHVTANSSGNYQATVTIPSDAAAGAHTIVVSAPGGSPRATASLTVTVSDSSTTSTTAGGAGSGGPLAFTGANVVRLVLWAALAVAVGFLLLAAARRRHE